MKRLAYILFTVCLGATLLSAQNANFPPSGSVGVVCPVVGNVLTCSVPVSSTGGFVSPGDGVHAGYIAFTGNTTLPVLAANTVQIVGPSTATFTGWQMQLMGTGGPGIVSPFTFAANGALSSSGVNFTGSPITGGTGTTTFPLLYHNNGASAPTGWSTSGTVWGFNETSGFAGNFIDAYVNGSEIFQVGASGFLRTLGNVQSAGGTNLSNGHTWWSNNAPSIASGFGGTPSIPNSNGTVGFTVNVGTGGSASTGVITMPSANVGWACFIAPNGAPQAAAVTYSAPTSSTSITLTNYTLTTGIALPWTASTVLQVSCWAY